MSIGTDRSSEPASPEDPPLDEFCHNEVFDVLGNRRRRYIVYYLINQDCPAACRELAEQVAAWENDAEPDQVATSQYQSVYNSLYQTHLPELEDTGLVRYDRSENLIYPTQQLAEVEHFVDSTVPRFSERLGLPFPVLIGGVLLLGLVGTFVLPLDSTYLYTVTAILVVLATVLVRGQHR